VCDTGVGMEPERAARLLQEGGAVGSTYGTDNEVGIGLGLQICRDFVRAHRGTLSVESVPGQGTSFFVTLPTAKEAIFPDWAR